MRRCHEFTPWKVAVDPCAKALTTLHAFNFNAISQVKEDRTCEVARLLVRVRTRLLSANCVSKRWSDWLGRRTPWGTETSQWNDPQCFALCIFFMLPSHYHISVLRPRMRTYVLYIFYAIMQSLPSRILRGVTRTATYNSQFLNFFKTKAQFYFTTNGWPTSLLS